MSCFKFLKITMFFFNSIIFLAGGAILGVGVWVKVDSGSLLHFLSGINRRSASSWLVLNCYLLIAVGAGGDHGWGCWGAWKQCHADAGRSSDKGAHHEPRHTHLDHELPVVNIFALSFSLQFFVIVLIIFIAEVAGAIVVLVFKSLVTSLVHTVGREVVKNIHSAYGKNQDFTGILNTTMDGLKCCGFYGYNDFTGSAFTNMTQQYPAICCGSAPCNQTGANHSNVTGCYHRVVRLIEDNVIVLGAVALGIAALEVAAMAVAMTLYCKIGKLG
ncbi:tetraspanin 35 [Anguilla rostrata]|uniref:tetraspanin 35 n=1 Tax=Anguilla rostrata TaxID=7938 RepID=UPI0030D07ED9